VSIGDAASPLAPALHPGSPGGWGAARQHRWPASRG